MYEPCFSNTALNGLPRCQAKRLLNQNQFSLKKGNLGDLLMAQQPNPLSSSHISECTKMCKYVISKKSDLLLQLFHYDFNHMKNQ